MAFSNEKIIQQLNTLIKINLDRIEGYKTVYKEAEDYDLRALFSRLRITSEECKRELETEVTRLGGTPENGTNTSGNVYRAWMDIKTALTGKDRKTILNSCAFGDDYTIETYQEVLREDRENFTAHQISMISAHLELIKADHDEIRSLRDLSPETV